MKKLIFLIFIFQFLYSFQSNINTWTSKELWNYIEFELSNKPLNKNYFLIDPNRYLQKNGKNELLLIENAQKKLFEETKIPNYIIFISNINFKKESIEDFAFSIAKNIYKQFPTVNISNSIISVFSIKDRKMRIRTGTILKNTISDSNCLLILNNRKYELRKGNYNKVTLDLINDINLAYNSKLTLFTSQIIIILIIISIIIIVSIIICCIIQNKNSKEEEQLDKIRDYLKKVKTNKKFVSESCVICLEEFNNVDNVSSLPCGHQFHTKCITEWMLKSKTCPLCKKEITNLNSNENKNTNFNFDNLFSDNITERIWEVQREIFPYFVRYNYSNLWESNNNRNRSNRNRTSNTNEKSSFNFSHDTGGGATSDW